MRAAEAAPRRVVGVDRLDLGVGEQPANAFIGLAGLGQDCVGHHSVGVEPAKRQDPFLEHRRDLIHIFGRLGGALGDEDRMTGAIGIGDVVADVVEQQHLLADLAVGQADPTRKGRAGHRHSYHALLRQLLVR